MFGFLGKLFSSVIITVTTLFGGHMSSPVDSVNIVTDHSTVVASTTANNPSLVPAKVNPIRTQIQAPAASTQKVPQISSDKVNLAIEKCKAENSKWLAAWPALEQAIRDKVRSDYQNALWSYAQQYQGIITAGDIASSTSNVETQMEQKAINEARTKFNLAGADSYRKCLEAIQ